MSKQGMRAAGVCLVTVAVMSGSVTANGAVASEPVQKLTADDFAVRFSAAPTRVVLSPHGGQTAAEYRIGVTHPKSIEQVDVVYLDFERDDGMRFNQFSMRGSVIREPSATRTVLSGGTDFNSSYLRKWSGLRHHRAFPGFYKSVHVSVFVDGDPVSHIRAKPPKGRVHLLYATRTVLAEPSLTRGDVVLRGRVLGYNGKLSAHPKKRWSAAADKRVRVLFLRRGATQPRVVTTAKTDSNGRYSVKHEVHRPGRWWIQFPGNRHLDTSRSVGYQVSVS